MFQRTEFQLGELLTNVRRNGLLTVAAVITVMASLTVFGLFSLSNRNLQNVLQEEARKAQISAFLAKGLSDADTKRVGEAIRAIPEVTDSAFVSSQQAWTQLKKDLNSPVVNALDAEAEGRLPSKYSVTPRNSQAIETVAAKLRAIPGVADVQFAGKVVHALNDLLKQVRVGGWFALLLLALATCAIISNAIRLTIYARRREIRIMQLVGATDWFIRVPFMLEGLFHGMVGGALAAGVTVLLYRALARTAASLLPFLNLVKPSEMVRPYAVGLVLLGAAIGVGSAFISMRQFLREA